MLRFCYVSDSCLLLSYHFNKHLRFEQTFTFKVFKRNLPIVLAEYEKMLLI